MLPPLASPNGKPLPFAPKLGYLNDPIDRSLSSSVPGLAPVQPPSVPTTAKSHSSSERVVNHLNQMSIAEVQQQNSQTRSVSSVGDQRDKHLPVDGNNNNNKSSNDSTASSEFQIEYQRINVSDEDKLLAMLGYKDLNRSVGPDGQLYFREEFCGACGIIHANPQVLDAYYNCKACHCVIREPSALRIKYRKVKPECVLEVLFATYGDPYDPAFAFDVTEKVKEKLREFQSLDRLVFRPREQMDQFFGRDPSPGRNKQLRVRYRMHGLHGTLVLDFNVENKIPVPFLLMAPKKQFLRIYSAMYGHPKGATKTGRMCFDVSEVLQSFVDQNGGSYLLISHYTPLRRLLGDPCPGYTKDLRIEFEIVGRSGELLYSEIRGQLTKRLMLQTSPCVSPIMNIQVAFYGITPTARKDRLDFIAKQLRRIDMIEHRRRQGLPIQPEDIMLLRNRGLLLEQRTIYQNAPTKFIDVTEKVQRLADKGKFRLLLDKDTFDPNEVFGNPIPGHPKILEVLVDCQGHDSERQTDSTEMMDTGYARNFITVKKNRFNIPVNDIPIFEDPHGRRVVATNNGRFVITASPGRPSSSSSPSPAGHDVGGQGGQPPLATASQISSQPSSSSSPTKRPLRGEGIRASATIGGLQMYSLEDPSTVSSAPDMNGPSIESMLTMTNHLASPAKQKKKKASFNNSLSSVPSQGNLPTIPASPASVTATSTHRPFTFPPVSSSSPLPSPAKPQSSAAAATSIPTTNTSHQHGVEVRGSLDMGLFGDDWLLEDDEKPPEKPPVIGGLFDGTNQISEHNRRHEQLLTLQRLQQEYRAEYGDDRDQRPPPEPLLPELDDIPNDKEIPSQPTVTTSVVPFTNRKIVGYRGVMQESLDFQTDYVAPLIIIKRATYGELHNLNNCIDVTRDIQYMARGRNLEITRDMNLNEIFHKDPCPGRRKQLKIEYIMRGFTGNLRVREKDDCLVANIELGYPPLPPPDDENMTSHDF